MMDVPTYQEASESVGGKILGKHVYRADLSSYIFDVLDNIYEGSGRHMPSIKCQSPGNGEYDSSEASKRKLHGLSRNGQISNKARRRKQLSLSVWIQSWSISFYKMWWIDSRK